MSMSLVHKTLFRSADLTQINFHDYINKLVDTLFNRYDVDPDRIALKIDAEDVSIGLETAIPCGLIVNELVSNSLRHAFPEGRKGELRIGLHVIDGNEYELIISDDGIGLPEGLDFRSAQSLGFRTVASFEKSGPLGEFVLNRTGGTEFRIKFRGDEFTG
jgi:two-component sensor histidine kinase